MKQQKTQPTARGPGIISRKIAIPWQRHSGFCGPAALRTYLRYFGIDKDEEYLAKLCETSERLGTHPIKLAKALKKLGFRVEYGCGGVKRQCWQKLNSLVNRLGLPVIVDWFDSNDGHYSVITRINKTYLWLADPHPHIKKDRIRKFYWDDFFRVWFDFEGDYMQKKSDITLRWWLVGSHAPLKKNGKT